MTPAPAPSSVPPSAGSLAERLAAITHDLLGAAGADRHLVWTNPAWQPLLGWSAAELAARSYHELIHPDDLARVREAERHVLSGRAGERPETELRLRARDGSYRWFVFSTSYAPDDRLVYFSGKDITQRKDGEEELRAAERALREAEDRFAGAFEGAAVGLLLAAPDGTLLRANRALCELTGRCEEALRGRRMDELVHPDERTADLAAIRAMLAGRTERLATERRILGAGGETPIARINLSLIRDTDGSPLHFVGQVEDVTERRRTLEALTLSEARYKGLISHLPDSTVHLVDPELRIVLSEGDRMRSHGYDPAAIEGGRLEDVLPPEAYERLAPEYRAALAGERRSFDWDAGDGTACYWVQIAPLRDEAGRVIGAMAVSRDITERRRAELALEDRARELERSNAELEQFAYVASHDLSEPLRMVSSYLQLLRRRYHGRLDGDADAFIDYAVDGASRMRDLIDGLLSYSRAGRGERPPRAVDTGAVLGRVVESLRAQEGARDIRLEAGALPRVLGDEQQIGQLFQNLVGNAIKFVPEERPAEVQVRAERDGQAWRFTVADNGIGLDPAHADRIFRMFQRLHTRDDYPGTGIGLAIAKKVVERHGGTIWAAPREGGGTEFAFTLPDAGTAA